MPSVLAMRSFFQQVPLKEPKEPMPSFDEGWLIDFTFGGHPQRVFLEDLWKGFFLLRLIYIRHTGFFVQ